jgi:hypothetical protein
MKSLHIRRVCPNDTEIHTEIRETLYCLQFYTIYTERRPVDARIDGSRVFPFHAYCCVALYGKFEHYLVPWSVIFLAKFNATTILANRMARLLDREGKYLEADVEGAVTRVLFP